MESHWSNLSVCLSLVVVVIAIALVVKAVGVILFAVVGFVPTFTFIHFGFVVVVSIEVAVFVVAESDFEIVVVGTNCVPFSLPHESKRSKNLGR